MDDSSQPEIDTIWDEAKAYIERGNFEKAIEIYKYILIRYEDDSVAIEYANAYLGDAYLTLRKLNRAENHLKKAIGIAPEKADYHYLLGFVYSIDCYWSKAIKEFEIAVMANSDNAEYLRGLGWAYFNNDNRSEGLGYLQKATKLDPSNINILLDLANAHLMMLDFDKAKMYGKKALLMQPGNSLAQKVVSKIEEFHEAYRQAQRRNKLDM